MFQLHWSPVPDHEAPALASEGHQLLAVWPAPVNHDECFAEAGFTEFGDNDEEWDKAAKGVLSRMIEALTEYGQPRLQSKPLQSPQPWYLRPFQAARPLPLLDQALQPMHWDSLPQFHARFGERSISLRTGRGHFLLWVTVPSAPLPDLQALVRRAAGSWPVVLTSINPAPLLPSAA